MARVTVEDCIDKIPNRFELVLLSAQRAKQIASGNPLTVDRDNDKNSVVSLREIAEQTVSLDTLMDETIASFSKVGPIETADEDGPSEEVQQELRESGQLVGARSVSDDDDSDDALSDGELGAADESDSGMSYDDENITIDD